MEGRDLIKIINAVNNHRTASAATKSAENLDRIARAHEESAEAAKIKAEAEAKAASIQASIRQQQYNQEKNLNLAKTELVRFSRLLNIDGASIGNLSGGKLHKLLLEQDEFKRNIKWIKESLSFESRLSEIERLRDILSFVEEASDAITQNPLTKDAQLIIGAVDQCDALEAKISESIQKISKSEELLRNLKDKIIEKYGCIPSQDDFLHKCNKDYEKKLNILSREIYECEIMGYPLLAASLVTFFCLGTMYAIPEVAVAILVLIRGAGNRYEMKSIRSELNKETNIYYEYCNLNEGLPKRRIDLQRITKNQSKILKDTLSDVIARRHIPLEVISEIIISCNGERFLK